MCAMALRPANRLVQRLARLHRDRILEQGVAFVDPRRHVMNRDSQLLLAMVHLPERGHHSLVSWQWRLMDVNATSRRNAQYFFFEYERARHRDQQLTRPSFRS